MMNKFQKITPRVAGLPCEIQVCNRSGHGILTTYDPVDVDTVSVAQDELVAFWDSCIDEFNRGRSHRSGLKPIVNGKRPGFGEGETELVNVKSPDFDLRQFEQITIMPYPLAGG